MRGKHDIINLTTSSYFVPMKTPKTKLEVIPPKDEEGDTFYVKTTPLQQIFAKDSLKCYWPYLWIPL